MNKAERTKQFIVAQTAPVFNRKGFAGTSLNDITAATGLTKGSIYGNFESKDEVALAVFDYNLSKVTDIFNSEMSKYHTIKEQLMVYVEVYSNFSKYPFPAGGCPMMNTATEADDTHPQLKKKAQDAILSWKKSLTRLIEKGMSNSELKPDINAEQTAISIIAIIEGATMIANLTGNSRYRKMVMQTVEKMINELS